MQFKMRESTGSVAISMLYRSGDPDVPYAIDRPYAPDIVNRVYREDHLTLNPTAYGLYNQSAFFEKSTPTLTIGDARKKLWSIGAFKGVAGKTEREVKIRDAMVVIKREKRRCRILGKL